MKILLTGSHGFIGSNLRRVLVYAPPLELITVDNLFTPNTHYNITRNSEAPNYIGDISNAHFINAVFKIEKPDYVINMAAQSFVDASIKNASPFIKTNILGAQILLDASVKHNVKKFLQVSTDEVYGHLQENEDAWTEKSPTNPRNPYSISKLTAEHLVKAANKKYNLPYIITRSSNNFGPHQPKRNLIPTVLHSIFNNLPIPVYGEGKQMREWIYVDDHCDAILQLLYSDQINQTFNIGSGIEMKNIDLVNTICEMIGRGGELITFVEDRKTHDQRYSINCDKIKDAINWKLKYSFEAGMKKTIEWYQNNKEYLTISAF